MKWAAFGLVLLGSVAAICAALLVNAMRAQAASARVPDTVSGTTQEVTVLYAKRTLPAMTVIENSVVASKTVSPDQVPPRAISSSTEVVGKVLAKPVVEGQPFTAADFNDAGTAQQVAAVIPTGKRAVGISVTNYAGLEALLYPGSMVDVLVSLKPGEAADGSRREALTTTLLENVQVLAIEQQTVVSPGKMADKLDSAARAGDARAVTLLVDSRQAKALQLGMEQGTLSLALRNPLDATGADKDAIWLQSLIGQNPRLANARPAEMHRSAPSAQEQSAHDPFAMVPTDKPKTDEPMEEQHWDTIIMRAGATETKSFPMPLSEEAE